MSLPLKVTLLIECDRCGAQAQKLSNSDRAQRTAEELAASVVFSGWLFRYKPGTSDPTQGIWCCNECLEKQRGN